MLDSETRRLGPGSALDSIVTLGKVLRSWASAPVDIETRICTPQGGRTVQWAGVQKSPWLVATLNTGIPRLDGSQTLTWSHTPG